MSNMCSQQSPVFYRGGIGSVPVITSGKGAYIFDADGNKFLDAMGGVAVQIVGHGNEEIREAANKALENYAYTYSQNFTTVHQEGLAQRLRERLDFPLDSMMYFGSGGSDANEIAMKFARQYHISRGKVGKYKVIGRSHAFHGNTFGTLSVSDRPSWRVTYDPYLFKSPKAPGWKTKRNLLTMSDEELKEKSIDELKRIIWSEGADTISAFILEPISGSSIAGAEPPTGYLEAVRSICDANDILLIADEVFVGYGRVGSRRASRLFNIEPDITTLGKGLGSGYAPLSACVLSPKVFSALGGRKARHQQGYTFSGIPLSCAIGVAVSDFVEKNNLFESARTIGNALHQRLHQELDSLEIVGEVRGRGMLAGIELVKDKKLMSPFEEELNVANKVAENCRELGVVVSPGSPQQAEFSGGDQIHLAPPYITDSNDIEILVSSLRESIIKVENTL